MTSNIVNFPIIPRATAIAPEEDPATAMLKAIDRCEKRYGERVTAVVLFFIPFKLAFKWGHYNFCYTVQFNIFIILIGFDCLKQ